MKVLLVEDHAEVAEISCMILSRIHGHEVRHAPTGSDALRIAAEFNPDIVVLDLQLPDIHGYTVARRLRDELGMDQTVIVTLTGLSAAEVPTLTSDHVDAHFTKPMDFKLLTTIRRRIGST